MEDQFPDKLLVKCLFFHIFYILHQYPQIYIISLGHIEEYGYSSYIMP